jgi:catechol 2,3-dioxygenase-like lactoylglutathione lyase family enzyme
MGVAYAAQMLDHVSISVRDLVEATTFYDAVMDALGYPCVYRFDYAVGYGSRNTAQDDGHSYLKIVQGNDPSGGERHWALRAHDRSAVERFYEAALASGGRDDGAPGLRAEFHPSYYAAFVLDPDGNRIEAVCHRDQRTAVTAPCF